MGISTLTGEKMILGGLYGKSGNLVYKYLRCTYFKGSNCVYYFTVFFIAVNIFLIKNKINGIGRIFPTALIRIPFHIVTSSNDDARIPPLSS